jgi:hypothetical protein
MEQNTLYLIVFEDESKFSGGNYMETKWKEIPSKKIKRIFYRLPGGDCLTLSGYDKYYHMIEATQDLLGKNRGKVRLRYAYIMGKIENKVVRYKISLEPQNNKSEIEKELFYDTDKEITKLNVIGWK